MSRSRQADVDEPVKGMSTRLTGWRHHASTSVRTRPVRPGPGSAPFEVPRRRPEPWTAGGIDWAYAGVPQGRSRHAHAQCALSDQGEGLRCGPRARYRVGCWRVAHRRAGFRPFRPRWRRRRTLGPDHPPRRRGRPLPVVAGDEERIRTALASRTDIGSIGARPCGSRRHAPPRRPRYGRCRRPTSAAESRDSCGWSQDGGPASARRE